MKEQINKILILVLLVLPVMVSSQIEFTEHNYNFDNMPAYSSANIPVDMDGDGDIDFIGLPSADYATNVWVENLGNGNFNVHEITGFDNNSDRKFSVDLDNDGDIDFLGSNGVHTYWLENTGNNNFTHTVLPNVPFLRVFSPRDLDGDGYIDLFGTNAFGDITTIYWYKNDGSQNFTQQTLAVSSFSINSLNEDIGDLDNDGDLDIIVKADLLNGDGSKLLIFENNGNNNFTEHVIASVTNRINTLFNAKILTADFDADNDKDIFSIEEESGGEIKVYWYENDGSLNFTKHFLHNFGTVLFESIQLQDINKDGLLDMVFGSYENGNKLSWYENNNNQSFIEYAIPNISYSPSDIQVVDINDDGNHEIITKGSIYENDGLQNFTKISLNPQGKIHYTVDLDNDGDLDLATSENSSLIWLENQLITNPEPPLEDTPYQAPVLSDENYIYTLAPQTEMLNTDNIALNKDAIESIIYFDGLGRPKQQVGIKQSGTGKDIITHIGYDEFGRQAQDFLPYVPSSSDIAGSFRTDNQENAINGYYQTHYAPDLDATPNPYSEKLFEASPLNRILEQTAPGADWKAGSTIDANGHTDGHTIKFDYQSNTLDTNDDNQDNVRLFRVSLNANYKPTLVNDKATDYYAANQLYKTVTKDENWTANQADAKAKNHTTEEFKDKQGRVILKRTYNANTTNTSIKNTKHDTYYVYDDYGNLTYVIPPRANINNNASTRTRALNELCYQYRYDERNRLVRKKIPGKGWESIVYDKLDRPILTQDRNLKDQNKWLFTKYDAFGRVVYTGKYTSDKTRIQLQNIAKTYSAENQFEQRQASTIGDTNINYTHHSFPENNLKVLTINYYDDYNFNVDGGTNPLDVLGIPTTTNTKSLATASQVRVLGTDQWVNTVTYYDKKARPIYSYTNNNYLNTVDIIKTQLDFIGNVQRTVARHTKDTNPTIKTIDRFTYDHANRLVKQTQQINNEEVEIIAENEYDELGQLIKKGVGNQPLNKHLQTIDYTYNIRGWLKGINDAEQALTDDLFAFKINYNTISTTAGGNSRLLTQELYNGNISETIWRTANDNKKRGYGYKYDALNRIKRARYKAGENLTTEKQFFDIKGVNYDKNGNIKRLDRFSPTAGFDGNEETDHLTYTYYQLSNRLKSVTDATGNANGFKDGNTSNNDYSYDVNGNLTSDANKGITSISYNHLNLPTEIKFDNSNTKKINYTYSADRTKLRKITNDNGNITITDYADNFVYENNTLKQFYHKEGYVEPNGNTYQYFYQLKDIWGNTRITFADTDGNGTIEIAQNEIKREQNYYPFGLEHKGYNNVIVGAKNNLKTYQRQEFTEDLGLNTHEWKFRMSDPAIGRFWQIDPLAEDYTYNSTYAFQENKMGMGVELEGLELFDFKMSFTDNLKLNFHAAKSFVKSLAKTGELGTPEGQFNVIIGLGKAIASPVETGRAIVNNISQTATDLNSTDPKVKGEAFGKSAAFIAETAVGAELANLAKVSKVATLTDDVAKLSKDAINVLQKEKSFLQKALDSDFKQLQNGKDQIARELKSGNKPNEHGIVKEVNKTIPESIKYKQNRINEINSTINKQ